MIATSRRGYGGPRRPATAQPIVALLEDVTARIIYLEESIEVGDYGLASDIARDLETDLAVEIARRRYPRRKPPTWPCPHCGLVWRSPGRLADHERIVHGIDVRDAA
jgi:hypothetical protein